MHHNSTDLIVRCGKEDFHVHRTMLVFGSEFFKKCLSENWNQDDKRLELRGDHDPRAFEHFLNLIYGDFDIDLSNTKLSKGHRPGSRLPTGDGKDFLALAQAYALADEFMATSAMDYAVKLTKALMDARAPCHCLTSGSLNALEHVLKLRPDRNCALRYSFQLYVKTNRRILRHSKQFQEFLEECIEHCASLLLELMDAESYNENCVWCGEKRAFPGSFKKLVVCNECSEARVFDYIDSIAETHS